MIPLKQPSIPILFHQGCQTREIGKKGREKKNDNRKTLAFDKQKQTEVWKQNDAHYNGKCFFCVCVCVHAHMHAQSMCVA